MSEFVHLPLIAPVEMLLRTEDLNERNTSIPDAVKPNGRQPVIHKQMR
jgi:hypothetical protein